jgi:hypothetical protein
MTTSLPATHVEAAALEFARAELARFASGTNPWSQDPAMSVEASQAMMRHLMRIIAMAKAGDEDAAEVLRNVLIECKSRRVELPTELAEYDLWQTHHGWPRRGPARKKKSYVLRDLCIAMTVAAVCDRFPMIRPTGRSARNRSGCQIVAEALAPTMSYHAVKHIWQRYGAAMPTRAGWAST